MARGSGDQWVNVFGANTGVPGVELVLFRVLYTEGNGVTGSGLL